jgi:hypothetical protein
VISAIFEETNTEIEESLLTAFKWYIYIRSLELLLSVVLGIFDKWPLYLCNLFIAKKILSKITRDIAIVLGKTWFI